MVHKVFHGDEPSTPQPGRKNFRFRSGNPDFAQCAGFAFAFALRRASTFARSQA